jgi:hypothetical protein
VRFPPYSAVCAAAPLEVSQKSSTFSRKSSADFTTHASGFAAADVPSPALRHAASAREQPHNATRPGPRVASTLLLIAGPGQLRIAVEPPRSIPRTGNVGPYTNRDFEPITFRAGVGVEASGVVDEVGPGFSEVSVGDAVFGYRCKHVGPTGGSHTLGCQAGCLAFDVDDGPPGTA